MSTAAPTRSAWFRTFTPRPAARIRLICFPHAGGAASAFRGWAAGLPASVEVTAVQFPGRQDRYDETPPSDMAALVAAITEEIGPLLDRPVAFFGHSMGATVAYEVARALPRELRPALVHLFASARRAPAECRPLAPEFQGDEGVLRYVRGLGGTGAALLADPALLDVALPVLRTDFGLIDTYRHQPGAPLMCPVTAIVGSDDTYNTPAEAQAWSHYTTAAFGLHVLPGGHFYTETATEELLEVVTERLAPAVRP
ncbi:thioesterase II family protein [Streptomyces sp. NPDC053079]|uniref:thioesterase II family protein n=1 Tax=Streptomyces sp. NPDC053079 TaxID=3365697 RepID=UPI0037CEA554